MSVQGYKSEIIQGYLTVIATRASWILGIIRGLEGDSRGVAKEQLLEALQEIQGYIEDAIATVEEGK